MGTKPLSYVLAPDLAYRHRFYRNFDADSAFSWAKSISPSPVFAINPGWYTKIATEQMSRLISRGIRMMYLKPVSSPRELRRKLLRYLPEGVYYWRNVVSESELCRQCPYRFVRRFPICFNCPNFLGQELMFDVDPERLLGKPRSAVGREDFYIVRDATIRLYDALSEQFSKLRIVFSGRGFHIHVFDRDTFVLSKNERIRLAESFKDYGVDVPVTAGGVSLARLPYTLNGISGLPVVPVGRKELESFDPYHSSSSNSSS